MPGSQDTAVIFMLGFMADHVHIARQLLTAFLFVKYKKSLLCVTQRHLNRCLSASQMLLERQRQAWSWGHSHSTVDCDRTGLHSTSAWARDWLHRAAAEQHAEVLECTGAELPLLSHRHKGHLHASDTADEPAISPPDSHSLVEEKSFQINL